MFDGSPGRSFGVSPWSSVTSGLRLWHGTASPLRSRLVQQHDVARESGRPPVYRDKVRGRREHLDRERTGWRHREHRADGQRVAGAIDAHDADVIAARTLRAGEGSEVQASGVPRGEPTEARESQVGRGDDARPALVT